MINFKNITGEKENSMTINPTHIYNTLDRRSDKGDLRNAQVEILTQWYESFRDKPEAIIKLHTGEGKTLIGLLILQSYLNEKNGPVLYLCPNTYLVDQTCKQAKVFGIPYSTDIENMPDAYEKDDKIYITTCQKLFNGKSKFGLDSKSKDLYAIIMDDAHQCLNAINDCFKINIDAKNNEKLYQQLLALFSYELINQGIGTFEEIKVGKKESFLQVPYWGWFEKLNDVTRILAEHSEEKGVDFAWNLLKNNLKDCECIVSGNKIEIYPLISLVSKFGSYEKAVHKVFMSATWNDDAFLVRTLGISTDTIKNSLIDIKNIWSGEKMILIPELISIEGKRENFIKWIIKRANKNFGIVSLVPSFEIAKQWEKEGSIVATKENLYSLVENLAVNGIDKVISIANRYDGIDLPDKACRILVLDSLPKGNSLEEELIEVCLNDSDYMQKKRAQIIEQGLGRAVRGSRDYCIIIILGSDLVNFIKSGKTKKYFSQQTRLQVEIGMSLSKMVEQDQKTTGNSFNYSLVEVINQSLTRDPGWKDYYTSNMNSLLFEKNDNSMLEIFEEEFKAEKLYKEKQFEKAIYILQNMIDKYLQKDVQQKGWYLQKMARYIYWYDKEKSIEYQKIAYKNNPYLLAIEEVKNLSTNIKLNFERMFNIKQWLESFESYEDMYLEITEILNNLVFAGYAEKFEKAVKDIGKVLGYESIRPDKEMKQGPDNLWRVSSNKFILIECKNEVVLGRQFISRDEVGQMSRSCSWFNNKYPGYDKNPIMIITTNKIEEGVYFSEDVKICLPSNLENFKQNISRFFIGLSKFEYKSLTEDKLSELLKQYNLDTNSILTNYVCETKVKK